MDKKSQHVGDHGGRYLDNDGMTKQFTYVDHDRHTTRLTSGREYKEPKLKVLTPQEVLIQDIMTLGINYDFDFIKQFDDVLSKKYGGQRIRRGGPVEYLDNSEEGWYNDLEKLFKDILLLRSNEFKNFQKKKYGL